MPAGRPTDYTPQLAETICEMVASGMTIRKICAEDGMPDKGTFCRWLVRHSDFADLYTRAKEQQADIFADDVVGLADEATPKNAHVKRLQVDARKWSAEVMKPHKYGRQQTQVQVSIGIEAVVARAPSADLLELKQGRLPALPPGVGPVPIEQGSGTPSGTADPEPAVGE